MKEHYDHHLGNLYSWMTGDMRAQSEDFLQFLHVHDVMAAEGETAVDLGAGNGIQSLALARCGYRVVAIDFNKQLLDELARNTKGYDVTVVDDDLRHVTRHAHNPAVVCCCGDTLTHLDSMEEVARLVSDIYEVLRPGGSAIFSFRDYSLPLEGTDRFIPVKSDATRILTCILDYRPEYVMVTDLLHERDGNGWRQSVSAYRKIRLSADVFVHALTRVGFVVDTKVVLNRMITLRALK